MTYDANKLLVSLADAKTYLAISDTAEDGLIGYLLQSISEMFATMCDRPLLSGAYTDYLYGEGHPTIYLNTYPVDTAEDITVAVDEKRVFGVDTQLDADDIWVNADIGSITKIGGVFRRGLPIKVTYTGGYASVPYDLRLAALEALGMVWKRNKDKRFDVASMSRGDVNYQFSNELPPTVTDVIKRYRRG